MGIEVKTKFCIRFRPEGPELGSKREIVSPYSAQTIGEVAFLGRDELNQALDFAEANIERVKRWPCHERARVLTTLAAKIQEHREGLAYGISDEGGKPYKDALIEVDRAAQTSLLAAEEAKRLRGRTVPMGATASSEDRLAMTIREPIGVVLAYSAFNHPLNLIAHQVCPAIAAGCPVLVKPAPTTPLSCMRMMALLAESGLPDNFVIPIPCSNEDAELLARDSRIALLSFVGSSKIGWKLRSHLAPGVRCVLEHGGVAPVIVDDSAYLSMAIEGITKGAFYHAGQVCVSVQRVYVHENIFREFTEALVARVNELVVGDPTSIATDVGPLIRPEAVERVRAWVEQADTAGARILCGGRPLKHQSYAPTVVVDVPEDCKLMREEIFGPVLAVNRFSDFNALIEAVNAPKSCFQAGFYSESLDRSLMLTEGLNVSALFLNDHSAFRVDWMPFGGHEESGLSLGGVGEAMKDLTREKLLVLRRASG
ncbi:MAG: aldehyde dehydrogenase family protein [Myxococcota bacterium]|nr:aldehyde dehydrogenase family protein [Myxococcota bacterium]